jgi:hypothetical protein
MVELSLAGRIALGVNDGKLTTDQAQQLDSQLQTINQAIQSGGSGISQLQNQLSEQIYGDAHNGAAIPADLTDTASAPWAIHERDIFRLTSDQGSTTSGVVSIAAAAWSSP